MGIKRKPGSISPGFEVIIDVQETYLTGHSVMEDLRHFKHDNGKIMGLDAFRSLSANESATRKKKLQALASLNIQS